MQDIKISVVIPIWNGAKTIEATIKGCLNQTLAPLEILVCDDGSIDSSREIVENVGDSRVLWLSGKHSRSPGGPRNRGMSIAKGEWLAICDSDDEWLPTKLEKQIKLIIKTGYLASCTNALIKNNGIITKNEVSNWKKETIAFNNLIHSNDIVCSSAIIHSSIFKEIGGFTDIIEYASFADYIYWLRVATKTNFAYVNEPLVIYDDHPENSLRSLFKDGKLLKKMVLANFSKWAKSNKKYFFYFLTKIYLVRTSAKDTLHNIIRSCFKK